MTAQTYREVFPSEVRTRFRLSESSSQCCLQIPRDKGSLGVLGSPGKELGESFGRQPCSFIFLDDISGLSVKKFPESP